MSTASDIVKALKPLGYPAVQNEYTGEEKTYFVFRLSAYPDNFANDEPQHERIMVMLHLFCPPTLDTTKLKKKVKLAMQTAGFTYPSEIDAGEKQAQHVVFECERAEGIDDGEL